AFRILTDDDKVDVLRCAVGERGRDAFEQAHGAQVDVLIESAPNWNQQAPQRDVVGDARIADRAQKHRVELLELLEAVFRHHAAGLRINLAAPVKMGELVRKAEFLPGCLENPQSFRYDLMAD